MKGKFNYLTYLLIFVVFLFFLAALYLIPKFALTIFESNKNKAAVLTGLVFAFLGTIYGIIVLTDLLVNYRYRFKLTQSGILVSDMLLLKHRNIGFDQIKSAQEDQYVYNIFLKAIIITLKSGKKYKMLNFFVWQYHSTKNVLQKTKQSLANVKLSAK
ncbi:MAG: hypothetical protein QM802_22395 [Agriterribacter sp.]